MPSCKEEDETLLVKVTTEPVFQISRTSAGFKGSMINEGTDTVIAFGFCWSTKAQPTFDDNKIVPQYMKTGNTTNGTFQGEILGLSPGATYYVKAYSITVENKIYGKEESFTTKPATAHTTFNPDLNYESVSDIDGNTYKTIKIGTQEWLAENLKTTRLNDGSSIPQISENNKWSNMSSSGYSWYNNNEAVFKNIYGGYYNWYAVNTGKLCPSGWHVPTDDDWIEFKSFLGMTQEQIEVEYIPETTAGNKIKETGTINWVEENSAATNESGFTALPGGWRTYLGSFDDEGGGGGWWSASVLAQYNVVLSHWVAFFTPAIYRSFLPSKNFGLNVRCVKD